MLDEARCRRAIGEAFPQLDLRSVRYFASGWDYELWEVNGELLFRFPQREECAGPLRKEARLLAAIAGTLPLAVPRPELVSEGCASFALPFFAYRRLAGEPLEDARLDAQAMEAIGRQLGGFLSALRGFPAERADPLGVPIYSVETWRQEFRDIRARCDREAGALLSSEERRAVEAFWARYFDDERYFRWTPALVHRDLGLAHILVDERGAVTGVIDFGDACVGDPAFDFGGLASLQGAALAAYGPPDDGTLAERAEIYRQIAPFHEVFYGLKIDSDEHVQAGLAGIRERITQR